MGIENLYHKFECLAKKVIADVREEIRPYTSLFVKPDFSNAKEVIKDAFEEFREDLMLHPRRFQARL